MFGYLMYWKRNYFIEMKIMEKKEARKIPANCIHICIYNLKNNLSKMWLHNHILPFSSLCREKMILILSTEDLEKKVMCLVQFIWIHFELKVVLRIYKIVYLNVKLYYVFIRKINYDEVNGKKT